MARLIPSHYVRKELRTSGASRAVNSFGTRKAKTWLLPPGGTQIDQTAARLQHEVALVLRDSIGTSVHGTMMDFAKDNNLDYERLRDILSGDRWASLDELVRIAHLLGLTVNVTLEESET